MSSVKSVVSRITGDLMSRGKVTAHWSFETQAGKVLVAARSDDGMFNAQQTLSLSEVKGLKEWLAAVEEELA